mgnify:CR=1 FL=1
MSDVDAPSGRTGRSDRGRAGRRHQGETVDVVVNGEAMSVNPGTLADLLAALGHATERVATAVNGEFVPRPGRASHPLRTGDRVEIVSPRQGG